MILTDILEDIDNMLPNPYTADEKVTFLNKTINEISRCAGKCDAYIFNANSHLRIYPLPHFIRSETIICVSLNGKILKPLSERESGEGYYLLFDNFLGLTVRPFDNSRVMVIFEGVNTFLKLKDVLALCLDEEDFLAQEISLDEEYRYLLLYGAMADIAAATEDTQLSNNLRAQFNTLKAEALQGKYKKRGKYPRTGIVI